MGLLNCLTEQYCIRLEYCGGKGYADIAIIPRDGREPFVIIELKDETPGTDDGRMQEVADCALEQIKGLPNSRILVLCSHEYTRAII